jgi:hypothetical protein
MSIDAGADGVLTLRIVSGTDGADRVTAQIEGLGEEFSANVTGTNIVLKTQVTGQRNWTSETPHLYRVTVTLKKGDTPLHTVTQRFGFRTIETRDGEGLFINGQRVLLKGCRYQPSRPESARPDAKRIREMNMNAVRTGNETPGTPFLDVCDELGLYVIGKPGEEDANHPCLLALRDVNVIRHPATPSDDALYLAVDLPRDGMTLNSLWNAARQDKTCVGVFLGLPPQQEDSLQAIRELWSPIQAHLSATQPNFIVTLESRYDFINLKQCRFKWRLLRFTSPSKPAQTINTGRLIGPDAPPGGKSKLRIPLPGNWRDGHLVSLEALSPRGESLQTWTWPVPTEPSTKTNDRKTKQ